MPEYQIDDTKPIIHSADIEKNPAMLSTRCCASAGCSMTHQITNARAIHAKTVFRFTLARTSTAVFVMMTMVPVVMMPKAAIRGGYMCCRLAHKLKAPAAKVPNADPTIVCTGPSLRCSTAETLTGLGPDHRHCLVRVADIIGVAEFTMLFYS